ncbi:transposase [Anoxybacillus rupiensis]|jgi:transposase-like protein|uniref:Mutator family transposase n=1 Tax=Anoxybacteroides rupiense TaxID=311460 RepID=A0ABT5W4P2_9BACL|nr:transposase [Anoxybacillus rupiensis]MDE8563246.1 transposase [Anoxybacillus rupiensis]
MNHFTTDLVQALDHEARHTRHNRNFPYPSGKSNESVAGTELTAFLDYEKYDRAGFHSGNSRNGNDTCTLHTEYGDLHLHISRDRNGDFKQQAVSPYKRSNDTLESFVIHIFQKGVTMAEIADLIEKNSTNLIESFNKQIKKYTKRKEQFPHEEALEKFLVSQFEDYNQRFATRCHIGFDQARTELQAMFKSNT